ncbi:DUF362 domain-containing protein [Alicyclobacillus sp.]|uniref:DUF362 domain-containing protein n=1 Tax=Alicyclobacillus sp. TaxID=61169 RepID=UPI0025BF4886|nr:DUF362 domain-containing protein [Alicyclobacillus sp.]MCL6517570.1 DUF362 domain-containing protein [Alicyclobacillus sp.]
MGVLEELLRDVPLPKMAPVRQKFDATRVEDVAAAVHRAIAEAGVGDRIRPGARVAIGVGSRGIANLPDLVRATVEVIRQRGAEPFIVPAMGSHGGATAEGQRATLEHLGVTEATVGAPVRATMEVVQRGVSAGGLPLYVDAHAAAADGIVVINRIKPHTSFRGRVESGLIKMLVIGLGKQRGAETAHQLGMGHMADHLLDLSAAFVERLPLWFGVGVIENAYDQTARVVAVPAERLHEVEPELLNEARARMPKILVQDPDVLVVDEMGKDISGVGMDPNITGRYPNQLVQPDIHITRVCVLRLTQRSDGNANGIGLADVTTAVLEAQIDRVKGYANCLTSTSLASCRLPMVLPTDRLAVQAAIKTCNREDLSKARVVRIRNTLHLERIWVSESVLPEISGDPRLEVLGPAEPMRFTDAGDLVFD